MKAMQIDQNNSAAGLPATKHRHPAKLEGVFAEIAALRRAIREHVAQERRASIQADTRRPTPGSAAWSGPRARSAPPGATWNTKILVL